MRLRQEPRWNGPERAASDGCMRMALAVHASADGTARGLGKLASHGLLRMHGCATQVRLTGDAYVCHCVETAAIVERLHASPTDLDALGEVDERWGFSAALCSAKSGHACSAHAS